MWKFLATPLQEMVRMNVIQHKILDNSYYIDFFAVKMKDIIAPRVSGFNKCILYKSWHKPEHKNIN